MIQEKKRPELEAVRGIAALIVVLHHYLLAFDPGIHGRNHPYAAFSLIRTPLYAFVNGSASVVLFFVLSGFVLSYRSFQQDSAGPVITSAIRRWPRLAFPVVVTNLVAATLVACGLIYCHQVEPITHSVLFEQIYTSGVADYPFISALKEGLYQCFRSEHAEYNFVLWTMHYEFVGSYIVFVTCFLAVQFYRFAEPIILVAAAIAWTIDPLMVPMVAGVMLACLHDKYPAAFSVKSRITWVVIGLITMILYGFDGYSEPAGFYTFMWPLSQQAGPRTLVHLSAGCLIMFSVLSSPLLRSYLSGALPGYLGRLSFPLYLTHVLIISSASSWAATLIMPRIGVDWGALVLFPPTVFLMLATAWPLMCVENWWLSMLRHIPSYVTRG
jgi:peptidoglycan/LPS O-acetylase OafA/YrhL